MATRILQQNCKSFSFWSEVELCGVECGISAFKSRFYEKYLQFRKLYRVIQRNNVQYIFWMLIQDFDSRLKILTNRRYVSSFASLKVWNRRQFVCGVLSFEAYKGGNKSLHEAWLWSYLIKKRDNSYRLIQNNNISPGSEITLASDIKLPFKFWVGSDTRVEKLIQSIIFS